MQNRKDKLARVLQKAKDHVKGRERARPAMDETKMTQTINLPIPPSTNALYRNVRSHRRGTKRARVKTAKYLEWIRRADAAYLCQARKLEPIKGPYTLQIILPRIRGDASNRIKAIEDFLVRVGLTDDDKFCQSVLVERDNNQESDGTCTVEVTACKT